MSTSTNNNKKNSKAMERWGLLLANSELQIYHKTNSMQTSRITKHNNKPRITLAIIVVVGTADKEPSWEVTTDFMLSGALPTYMNCKHLLLMPSGTPRVLVPSHFLQLGLYSYNRPMWTHVGYPNYR